MSLICMICWTDSSFDAKTFAAIRELPGMVVVVSCKIHFIWIKVDDAGGGGGGGPLPSSGYDVRPEKKWISLLQSLITFPLNICGIDRLWWNLVVMCSRVLFGLFRRFDLMCKLLLHSSITEVDIDALSVSSSSWCMLQKMVEKTDWNLVIDSGDVQRSLEFDLEVFAFLWYDGVGG